MNRSDLTGIVAEALVAQELVDQKAATKTATAAVNAALTAIQAALADGDKVALSNFGVFERAYRAERDGRNPHTGERMRIAGSWGVKFAAYETLKNVVAAAAKDAKVPANA